MGLNELNIDKYFISLPGKPRLIPGVNRNDLAKFMGQVGFRTGAEIGVWRGAYSEIFCQSIPNLHLYCVDPWLAFRNNSQERMDSRYARTVHRLRNYDVEILKMTGMEALSRIPNRSLDFVYIDAMHEFDPFMVDLILWTDKVRPGGIVAGHDYIEPVWHTGVKPAVHAYTEVHGITDWYITDVSVETEAPSFFWARR